MGVDVVVGGATGDELDRIERHFERWEQVFSRFRADSELNHVNGPSPRSWSSRNCSRGWPKLP